jgi:hypothetical protein
MKSQYNIVMQEKNFMLIEVFDGKPEVIMYKPWRDCMRRIKDMMDILQTSTPEEVRHVEVMIATYQYYKYVDTEWYLMELPGVPDGYEDANEQS